MNVTCLSYSLRLGRKRKMCLIPRSVDGIFAIFFSFSFLNLLPESFLDKSSDGICTFSFFSAIKVQRIVHDEHTESDEYT